MASHCLFFILIYLHQVSGQPFLDYYGGKTVKGTVGSSINFTWAILRPFTKVEWGLAASSDAFGTPPELLMSFRDGNLESVIPPTAYSGRVSGKITGSQVSFTLKNLKKSDGRLYGCKISDLTDGDDIPSFDSVVLIVEGPPEIIFLSPNTTVNEGESVTLTCNATGPPPANITWSKNNEDVTFPLNNITREDAGSYQCEADNGVGKPATAGTSITVQYAATIQEIALSSTQSWIGQTITLTCKANGVPKPNITWIKPDRMEIKKIGVMENMANAFLRTEQDFGNYTCVAENGVGAVAAAKTLQVQQIKAPGSPNVTMDVGATSIKVSWRKPADDGGSPITAYRVLVLKGNTTIHRENITIFLPLKRDIGGLTKSTNYTVKVFARNYVFEGNATEKNIQTKFEGVPAAAEIIDLPAETKETEIILKWKEAEKNGAAIEQYTVYQRTVSNDSTSLNWIKLEEIKDPSVREVDVKLEKNKEYEFVVTATNKFGQGGKDDEKIRKIKVLGDVPSAVVFTYELKGDEVILRWEEPNNNGAEITLYTVYHGSLNDEHWKKIEVSSRNYAFKVEMGKKYRVLVTASNKYGESSKKGMIQQVNVPEGSKPSVQPKTGKMNTAVIAGAAAAGVLVIAGVIIFAIWWKRRKSSPDDASPSSSALRSDNPYELDDGYQDVSASVAARGLQAEAGPVTEPDYAQVDMSKKKRNRRPVTDEYSQVDKSKKSKKPRKQPGELDYAELDDFRPSVEPAAAAAAEAAPARPLIRRPVYEGTEYADITQFGVPQPEPTYGNMPRKDVVYSNVQGI